MRPPPRRVCAITNAEPGAPNMWSPETRTFSYLIYAWLACSSLSVPTPTLRTMFTPGVSVGTISMLMPSYGLTSGSVTAITIKNDA